jgi:hypothetical protein
MKVKGNAPMYMTLGNTVPNGLHTTLTYKTELFPVTTSGSVYHYAFRGNDIYDPDYTGTGGQPRGYDQFAAFYTLGQVKRSRIEVRGSDTASSSSVSTFYISLVPTVSASDVAAYTPEEVSELPDSKSKIFLNHNADQSQNVLSNSMTTSRFLGCQEASMNGTVDFSTLLTGTLPPYGYYWHINVQDVGDSASLADIQLFVTIHYDVYYWGRKTLPSS